MNDRELHSEFDDELLSAYLDDELSADERAAVEARLADDPAARQLLDQLRSVSQSVQGLPEESLGRDLRAPILRHVASGTVPIFPSPRGKMGLSPSLPTNGAPSLLDGDPMPRISIGRSRRSWIWASLAVAAALFIMFVQSGDQGNKELPTVARRDEDVSRELAEGRASDRKSVDESGPAAPGSGFARTEAPAISAPPASTVASADPRHDPVPPSDSMSRSSTFTGKFGVMREAAQAGDSLAASVPSAAASDIELRGEGGAVGGPAAAKAPQGQMSDGAATAERARTAGGSVAVNEHALEKESMSQADQDQDVVVRVVAKRTALDNKTIDQLLAKNGIAVDAEQLAGEKSEVADRGLAERAKLAPAPDQAADQPAETIQVACDVVVVDASHKAIASCVSELNRDLANYTSVEVDDAAGDLGTSKDKQPQAPTTLNKQVASDLRRFNRGTVPENQKEFFARNQEYYFQQLSEEDRARDGSTLNVGGEAGGRVELELKKQTELLDRASQNVSNEGRAWRVSNSKLQNLFSEEQLRNNAPTDAAIVSGAYKLRAMQPAAKAANKLADENLRVWFFICPEEPAMTSAPGKDGAK